jgi:predicted GNAT superfamily acetyltransferase
MTIHYDSLDDGNWAQWREAILELEAKAYEASRQDRPETLERIILDPRGVSLAAFDGGRLAGFCLGAPLERFAHVRGPAEDPGRGDSTVLYSADTCVSPAYRGKGVGRELKTRQLALARSAGYQLIAGRNRAGLANAMWQLNRSLGARAVHLIEKDYEDGIEPDICIYYHIKLDPEIIEHGST